MQEESRSEHNGMSNAEYATKINEEANSGKEYQEYLGAKESQHAITHLTPEQKLMALVVVVLVGITLKKMKALVNGKTEEIEKN